MIKKINKKNNHLRLIPIIIMGSILILLWISPKQLKTSSIESTAKSTSKQTTISATILPDETAPEPPIIEEIIPSNEKNIFLINLKAERGATFYINGIKAGQTEKDNHQLTILVKLESGYNTFQLETEDFSGNRSDVAEIVLFWNEDAASEEKNVTIYEPIPIFYPIKISTLPLPLQTKENLTRDSPKIRLKFIQKLKEIIHTLKNSMTLSFETMIIQRSTILRRQGYSLLDPNALKAYSPMPSQ